VTQTKGTLRDLIDGCTAELYPLKPWGRTKKADLKRLKKDLGVTVYVPSGASDGAAFLRVTRPHTKNSIDPGPLDDIG
jgi:hypothetical protein